MKVVILFAKPKAIQIICKYKIGVDYTSMLGQDNFIGIEIY